MKHVLPGLGLFFILAIPALALDFVNQGIEMIEFQRVITSQPSEANSNSPSNNTNSEHVKVIRASGLVRSVLLGVEYLILIADVVLVLAVVLNGTWIFVKALKW